MFVENKITYLSPTFLVWITHTYIRLFQRLDSCCYLGQSFDFIFGSKALRLRGSAVFSRPSFAHLLRDFHQREHGRVFGELPFNREVSVFPEQRNLNVFRLVLAKFRKTGRRIFNAKRLRCLVVECGTDLWRARPHRKESAASRREQLRRPDISQACRCPYSVKQ